MVDARDPASGYPVFSPCGFSTIALDLNGCPMRLQGENRAENVHAGIYIHIPFCVRKCPYCGFYSITDLGLTGAFVDALVQEIRLVRLPKATFDTIYIGGGTPSLIKHVQLRRIIDSVLDRFPFAQDIEVSIEVNPGTVSLDFFKAFLSIGINRINIGIQSFDDRQLQFLGRVHSAREAEEAIRMARAARVENLGFDLMYGLPDQSAKDWIEDLKEATGYEPEHISCYMLTYEEGTPFDEWRKAGRFGPVDEETLRDLFEVTVDFLSHAGYEQYETSNFARGTALRSRHNQKYWCHAPYIGLGPSAHSFFEQKRWWNFRSLSKYIQALQRGELAVEGSEELNRWQLILESVFLGLRTSEGIDMLEFERRYNVDFLGHFGAVVKRLQARGLLSVTSDRCALSMEGMIFADTVAAMFADHTGE